MRSVFKIMQVNAGVGKLITVMISVLFIVHTVACVWYAVAEGDGFPELSWVVRNGLLEKSAFENYVTSYYWAFTTLTTVGYGDINARTYNEKIIAIFWMVFGVGFYSFTIGNFQTIINEIDVRAYHLQIKLDTLHEFSKRNKLPESLQKEISSFISNNAFDEAIIPADVLPILSEMPMSLKGEVAK